jgi:dTDP-4-amino-4,6-dideoxygalactose transaminase
MGILHKLRRLRSYRYDVPWCVPDWDWRELRAALRAIGTLSVVHGSAPEHFAEEVKNRLGRRFAVGAGRGRDAIYIALRALHLQPGDEVVIPSYVCASVRDAVALAGATPVFADVDETMHLSARSVEAALTPRTRMVIAPHLFGNSAPVEEIESLLHSRGGIALLDDAAQGLGCRRAGRSAGSFGDFSLVCGGPGKPLASTGGALLLMDDPEHYHEALQVRLLPESAWAILRRVAAFWIWRRLRRHTLPLAVVWERILGEGQPEERAHCLNNLEAAILSIQLDKLAETRSRRELTARTWADAFNRLEWRTISDLGGDAMVLKLVVLLQPNGPSIADAIRDFGSAGIECQRGYVPCHLQQGSIVKVSLPVTEALWERVLCVPVESPPRNRQKLDSLFSAYSKTDRDGT